MGQFLPSILPFSLLPLLPPNNDMPLLSGPNVRFLGHFYLIHIALVLLYLTFRCFVWSEMQLGYLRQSVGVFGIALFPRELEIFLLLTVVLVSKYRKSPTIDHFLMSCTLFSKVYLAAMLWNVDRQLMGWFTIIVFTLFALLKTPQYKGPTKVVVMDHGSLQETVIDASQSSSKNSSSKNAWLVEITAGWHTGSLCYAPTFAELSLRFSSDDMHFATVDVSRSPKVAENLKINTSAYNSVQLPSYILFENGKEVKRLPPLDPATGKPEETLIQKEGIIQFFDLSKNFLASKRSSKKK